MKVLVTLDINQEVIELMYKENNKLNKDLKIELMLGKKKLLLLKPKGEEQPDIIKEDTDLAMKINANIKLKSN